jgi:lysophospholipase
MDAVTQLAPLLADAPDPDAAPRAVPELVRQMYVAADRYDFVTSPDGAKLRYAFWRARAERPRGTILLLNGRGEFIEKYAIEIVPELRARGFAIWTMDWRGQGLSARALPDSQKGHIDRFETYLTDLGAFIDFVAASDTPRPIVALTHSMGAHILLRHFAERGSEPIKAGVMVAPMTGLRSEAIIRVLLSLLPATATIDQRYFYGGAPFRLVGREFIGNKVTNDQRRFRFAEAWYVTDPRLPIGGPTIGWLRQAVKSIRQLVEPAYLARIKPPMLILSAKQDLLVDSRTHAALATRLPNARVVDFEGARHEIMMETDKVRARFWTEFDRFTAEHAPLR